MKIRSLSVLTILSLGLMFTSCGGEKTEEADSPKVEAPKDTTTTEEIVDVDDEFESEDESAQLPSALQVASVLESSGLTYVEGLTHDISKQSSYASQSEKSLNFGVYSADMAYCVMNEKYNEIGDMMGAVRNLGSETGLGTIFNSEDLLDRFESNKTNKDSIISVLLDINFRTESILEEDKSAREAATIHFTGAWIEGMYLGAKTYDQTHEARLGYMLVEQMNVLDRILINLEKNSLKDDLLTNVESDLNNLRNTFKNFGSVVATLESEDGYYTAPELTEEELATLSEHIFALRTKIING